MSVATVGAWRHFHPAVSTRSRSRFSSESSEHMHHSRHLRREWANIHSCPSRGRLDAKLNLCGRTPDSNTKLWENSSVSGCRLLGCWTSARCLRLLSRVTLSQAIAFLLWKARAESNPPL